MIDEAIILLSMGLTPMTIFFAGLVVYFFRHSFKESILKSEKNVVNWMILGIVINFVGNLIDNLWWGIAWSLYFVENDGMTNNFFFTHGSYSNVLFRQTAGILGALCHIRSAWVSENTKVRQLAWWGAIIGVLYAVMLIFIRSTTHLSG